MGEICFNTTTRLGEKDLPKCIFYEYSDSYFGRHIIREDDPTVDEKLKKAKQKHYVHKTESSNHYFEDKGFPQCTVCGWTP